MRINEESEEENYYARSNTKQSRANDRCYLCNKKGHYANKCFKRRCKVCDGKGHTEKECPTKPRKKSNFRSKKFSS